MWSGQAHTPGSRTAVHRWVDHTSELELEIEAESEPAVFAEALAAMGELLRGERPQGEPAEHEVELAAPDRAVLLADWLSELAYLAEAKAFVPERAVCLALEGDTLSATVAGRGGEPPHLVKAVTYHRLELRPADGGWRGRVVLDV